MASSKKNVFLPLGSTGDTTDTIDSIPSAHEVKSTPFPGVVELCRTITERLAAGVAEVDVSKEIKGKSHLWCKQVKNILELRGYDLFYRALSPYTYDGSGSEARMTVRLPK